MVDLIGLRDAARLVLKTQNAGRVEEEREGPGES